MPSKVALAEVGADSATICPAQFVDWVVAEYFGFACVTETEGGKLESR